MANVTRPETCGGKFFKCNGHLTGPCTVWKAFSICLWICAMLLFLGLATFFAFYASACIGLDRGPKEPHVPENQSDHIIHPAYCNYPPHFEQKNNSVPFWKKSFQDKWCPMKVDPANIISKSYPEGSHNKNIALLFLTIDDVNQPMVWRQWFCDSDPDTRSRFNIYVHNKFEIKDPFFEKFQIMNKTQTSWGTDTLVRASILLLQEALENRDNSHFVLLSESQIPLVSAEDVFKKVAQDSDNKSKFYTGNFSQPSDSIFGDLVKHGQKADQWWILTREAAMWFSENIFLDRCNNAFAKDERYFVELMELAGLRWKDECSTYCNWNTGNPPKKYDAINHEDWKDARDKNCLFLRQVNAAHNMEKEVKKDIEDHS